MLRHKGYKDQGHLKNILKGHYTNLNLISGKSASFDSLRQRFRKIDKRQYHTPLGKSLELILSCLATMNSIDQECIKTFTRQRVGTTLQQYFVFAVLDVKEKRPSNSLGGHDFPRQEVIWMLKIFMNGKPSNCCKKYANLSKKMCMACTKI